MIPAEIIDPLWKKAEPFLFITREQFERGMETLDITPYRFDGELTYVTFVNGPEFHYEVYREGHTLTKGFLREVMRPICLEHGYVTTKTPKHETRQHRFNKTIGFKKTGEDEFNIHYRMDMNSAPWLR